MSAVSESQDNVVHVHVVAGQLMLLRRQTLERNEPRSVINGLMLRCSFRLNIEKRLKESQWPWRGLNRFRNQPVSRCSRLYVGKSRRLFGAHFVWMTMMMFGWLFSFFFFFETSRWAGWNRITEHARLISWVDSCSLSSFFLRLLDVDSPKPEHSR